MVWHQEHAIPEGERDRLERRRHSKALGNFWLDLHFKDLACQTSRDSLVAEGFDVHWVAEVKDAPFCKVCWEGRYHELSDLGKLLQCLGVWVFASQKRPA